MGGPKLEEIYRTAVGEKVFKWELNNGLTLFVMPRNNFRKQYAVFAAGCGSIDLNFINPENNEKTKVPAGTAHFLEHKLFEDKKQSIFNSFASLGSSTNAYTGFTNTSYLFSGTINFQESLIRLIDFVQDPYFTEDNVEKEKSIIAREINMYEDKPGWQIYFKLLQGLFNKHPVRYDIAGTIESIKKITAEDLNVFYNTFYHPGNMVLFVTGDLLPEKIYNLVAENQMKKRFNNRGEPKKIYPDEPDYICEEKIKLDMDVSLPYFSLGYKENNLDNNSYEQIKQEIATNMLLDIILGKSSFLYKKLYNENLIDENFSVNYRCEDSYGYVKISGKSPEPEKLFNKIILGLKDCEQYINNNNFERIHKKYFGNFIASFNSFEQTASEFITFYFRKVNLMESINILDNISLSDLNKQYNNLFLNRTPVQVIIS